MHGVIPGSGKKFWTDERIKLLKTLAAEKKTGGEIARSIGATRSSVISKLSRIGVPLESGKYCNCNAQTRSPKPIRRVKSSTNGGGLAQSIRARKADDLRARERNLALGELESCEATDLPPEPNRPVISLQNLRSHHCRWPIGDPGSPDFGFCGEDIRDESVPYCTHHCRIAYRGKPAREDYYVAGGRRIMGGAYD